MKVAMLQHCLFADSKGFEGFEKKVAQVVVESFTDGIDLLFWFARESIAKVLPHYSFAIAYAVIQQKIDKVGKQVKYREG